MQTPSYHIEHIYLHIWTEMPLASLLLLQTHPCMYGSHLHMSLIMYHFKRHISVANLLMRDIYESSCLRHGWIIVSPNYNCFTDAKLMYLASNRCRWNNLAAVDWGPSECKDVVLPVYRSTYKRYDTDLMMATSDGCRCLDSLPNDFTAVTGNGL